MYSCKGMLRVDEYECISVAGSDSNIVTGA